MIDAFVNLILHLQMMMRQYRRPFLLLNMLFVLMTFSGKFAIGFYAVEVFHDASSGLNEYFSAIVVGRWHFKLTFLYPLTAQLKSSFEALAPQ